MVSNKGNVYMFLCKGLGKSQCTFMLLKATLNYAIMEDPFKICQGRVPQSSVQVASFAGAFEGRRRTCQAKEDGIEWTVTFRAPWTWHDTATNITSVSVLHLSNQCNIKSLNVLT